MSWRYFVPSCPPMTNRYDPICVDECESRRYFPSGCSSRHAKVSTHGQIAISSTHNVLQTHSLTQIERPHVVKALLPVTSAHNNHDAPNKIGSMIPPRLRNRRIRTPLLNLHPLPTIDRHRKIKPPQIVQGRLPIPASEDVKTAPVENGSVCTAGRGELAFDVGVCPAVGDGV